MMRFSITLLIVLSSLTTWLPAQVMDFERAPIYYSKTDPQDPLTKLDFKKLLVPCPDERTYLERVLNKLEVPLESQVLVFSKTSHQNGRISPDTPRAIYFNDEVYVGWVQGGLVEFASFDPALGMVFYTLDPRDKQAPTLERPQTCLNCHAGSRTRYVPGLMVRSVYPDVSGYPILSNGSFMTDHTSPLHERWGGWYVTGFHGDTRHMGNVIAEDLGDEIRMDTAAGSNITELGGLLDTRPYLRDSSDIVSLMVLEHQTSMHNALLKAGLAIRQGEYNQKRLYAELKEILPGTYSGSLASIAESQATRVVQQILFCDEMEIGDDGIEGDVTFQTAFQYNKKTNTDGKSLKDFHLYERLFKYRCSYMIYSQAFEVLPRQFKEIVYDKLWQALTDETPDEAYSHLRDWEKETIRSILVETKSDLPAYWKS
jgi:hypothetical protein